jgi:hypothetical protein
VIKKEPAIKMNRSADGESSRWKTFQYLCEKQILKKQNTSTLRYWAWFNDQTTTILHSIQQTTLFLRHFKFWKTRVWIIQQDFVNKVNTCVVLRLPSPSICLPNEITLRTQACTQIVLNITLIKRLSHIWIGSVFSFSC